MGKRIICTNGCPPDTDLRTCLLAFMGECPVLRVGEDGGLYFDQKKSEMFNEKNE